MPVSRYVKAHGLWFHYLEWEADGPVAVLAHRASFSAWVWAPLANALHQRGYRVLSMDLKGHGDTETTLMGDYKWFAMGKDMAELLDKLDIADALAIGHSTGAVALMLGEALSPGHTRYGFHMEPSLVFRPWLPEELTNGMDPLSIQAMKRRTTWSSHQQLTKECKKDTKFKKWRKDYLNAYVEGCTWVNLEGMVELKCSPEVEARIYQGELKAQPKAWDILRSYRTPTTVLVTQPNDRIPTGSKELVKLRHVAHDIRVVALEGASHDLPMEKPEEFERLLWEFVETVEKEEALSDAMAQMEMGGPGEWPVFEVPSLEQKL